MKLIPTKVTLADGSKLINGYKVTFAKSEIERIGLKGGDELTPTYEKNTITLKKKKTK